MLKETAGQRPGPDGVAAIPLWLPFYERTYEKLSDETKNKLLSISAATIDRLLAQYAPRLAPEASVPPSQARQGGLRNQIPIRTHNWDISQPGFVEADTVAHSGQRPGPDGAATLWPATSSGA